MNFLAHSQPEKLGGNKFILIFRSFKLLQDTVKEVSLANNLVKKKKTHKKYMDFEAINMFVVETKPKSMNPTDVTTVNID